MDRVSKVESEDNSYHLPYDPQTKKKSFLKWNMHENLSYIQFLDEHKDKLYCQFDRRSSKVFFHMSRYVKTRNAEQCRTHHQKMVQGYKTIDGIINGIREKNMKKGADKGSKQKSERYPGNNWNEEIVGIECKMEKAVV